MDFPEENEFVIATVKKIFPHGAFCTLLEYNNLEAYLPLAEVSSGWVKNIHEFLSEGQRLVVKVIRVNKEKSEVDVSLRRVNEDEKRRKLESVKRAARAKKLIEYAAKKCKSKIKIDEIIDKLNARYQEAYFALEKLIDGEDIFKDINVSQAFKENLTEIVKKNLKKSSVTVSATLTLKCFLSNGIEVIKKVLNSKDKAIKFSYLGAPKYKIEVEAENYKIANKKLNSVLTNIKKSLPDKCFLEYELNEK